MRQLTILGVLLLTSAAVAQDAPDVSKLDRDGLVVLVQQLWARIEKLEATIAAKNAEIAKLKTPESSSSTTAGTDEGIAPEDVTTLNIILSELPGHVMPNAGAKWESANAALAKEWGRENVLGRVVTVTLDGEYLQTKVVGGRIELTVSCASASLKGSPVQVHATAALPAESLPKIGDKKVARGKMIRGKITAFSLQQRFGAIYLDHPRVTLSLGDAVLLQ